MTESTKAIVIGSGFGGLAAAVRLGARGYDVTVVERLEGPGGRAFVYRDDGNLGRTNIARVRALQRVEQFSPPESVRLGFVTEGEASK